jgi:hypothetical protein
MIKSNSIILTSRILTFCFKLFGIAGFFGAGQSIRRASGGGNKQH